IHRVNASSAPLAVGGQMTLLPIAASSVTAWVNGAGMWIPESAIDVPPGARQSVKGHCAWNGGPIAIVTPHAHRGLSRFTVDFDGARVVDTQSWDPAPFVRRLPLAQPSTIAWQCDFENDGNQPVLGGGDQANQMCVVVMWWVDSQPRDMISCQDVDP